MSASVHWSGSLGTTSDSVENLSATAATGIQSLQRHLSGACDRPCPLVLATTTAPFKAPSHTVIQRISARLRDLISRTAATLAPGILMFHQRGALPYINALHAVRTLPRLRPSRGGRLLRLTHLTSLTGSLFGSLLCRGLCTASLSGAQQFRDSLAHLLGIGAPITWLGLIGNLVLLDKWNPPYRHVALLLRWFPPPSCHSSKLTGGSDTRR